MSLQIFDIEESSIKINSNVLLIPELKAIVDTYEDPIQPLCYVHYMSDPFGPYSLLPEEEKEELVSQDYEGDYTPDDEPIYKAIEKLRKLYETPSMRLLRQAKIGLKKLGDHLEHIQIREDRDVNNFTGFRAALRDVRKISQEFNGLWKDVQEEYRIRGNSDLGYDEV